MKVFVTGVSGQLGYAVMNELKKRNYCCIGADIVGSADIQLDITDKTDVKNVLTQIKPDAVIHCAAWTAVDAAEDEENKDQVFAVNVTGTKNISEVCISISYKIYLFLTFRII